MQFTFCISFNDHLGLDKSKLILITPNKIKKPEMDVTFAINVLDKRKVKFMGKTGTRLTVSDIHNKI